MRMTVSLSLETREYDLFPETDNTQRGILLIWINETKTNHCAGVFLNVCLLKHMSMHDYITCLSVSSQHLCLMTNRKQLLATASRHLRARQIGAGYFPHSKQISWWILARISSKSIVMLFWMECSWNICCPEVRLTGAAERHVVVRTQSPLGARGRPGAAQPFPSGGESALLNQEELQTWSQTEQSVRLSQLAHAD